MSGKQNGQSLLRDWPCQVKYQRLTADGYLAYSVARVSRMTVTLI